MDFEVRCGRECLYSTNQEAGNWATGNVLVSVSACKYLIVGLY